MTDLDADLLAGVRDARRAFLRNVEPHRPDLYRYCRRLTGNAWDAEDLVQDTLAKAFARAAQSHAGVDNVAAWLVRVATNAYIDGVRRAAPLLTDDLDRPAAEQADPAEVSDALRELMTVLPPQERAAVVLKDVFDLPLAEIASLVGTSVGAVKSALHRGRGTLADPTRRSGRAARPAPDRAVLAAVAEAFTAYDVEAVTALLREDSVLEIVGMVYETGPDQMRDGSLHHTFVLEDDVRYRAEVREFDGEPVMAVWSTRVDGTGTPGVSEVWRCETADGRLVRLANYFFCPEVVAEICAGWGVPTVLHGYRFG